MLVAHLKAVRTTYFNEESSSAQKQASGHHDRYISELFPFRATHPLKLNPASRIVADECESTSMRKLILLLNGTRSRQAGHPPMQSTF